MSEKERFEKMIVTQIRTFTESCSFLTCTTKESCISHVKSTICTTICLAEEDLYCLTNLVVDTTDCAVLPQKRHICVYPANKIFQLGDLIHSVCPSHTVKHTTDHCSSTYRFYLAGMNS